MGAFKSAVITKKGQALIAKVVAGTTKFEFTKVAVSENTLTGDLASKTGIGTIKQSEKVASVVRQNGSNVKVSTSFSNQTLGAGYYVRNIGLYANDPQEGEICYSISVADESTATADWMPPFNGIGVSSLLVDLVTAVSNASSVNVTVDPSAGATVAQITNLQEQIDDVKTFVGYEGSDVYGVEVDYSGKKFTRLAGAENMVEGADFSALSPWNRRRCILTNDGVVLAYRGETGYVENGTIGVAITKTVDGVEKKFPAGTKVQVMVEQPIFYVKVVPVKVKTATSGKGREITKARYYISPTPKVGFKVPEGFLDNNGIPQDKIYLSAYEGSLCTTAGVYNTEDKAIIDFTANMLSSVAGSKPASGLSTVLTRANVRRLCNNRGAGWMSHNIYALSVTQWLILVEYASMDCQRKIGRGVCDFIDDGSTNMALVTGGTADIGNCSGIQDGGVNGRCSVTYRGEENLWGNVASWLDGINILAKSVNEVYLCKTGFTMADDTINGYENYGTQLSHQNGYQSAMGYSESYPEIFLPTACAGTDALQVGDYYWQNYNHNGLLLARIGGVWHNNSTCGAWSLVVIDAALAHNREVGGRLLYVPQTKVA